MSSGNIVGPGKKVDIVVARYNEDLRWTLEETFRDFSYIVYNKGDNDNFEKKRVSDVIKLKNVGRNDHTYLYHVVKNYDRLADITVFLTGSVNLLEKHKKALRILHHIQKKQNAVLIASTVSEPAAMPGYLSEFRLDWYCATDEQNRISDGESCSLQPADVRPFGKWYENRFQHTRIPHCITHGGIFSANKKDILKRDKSWYINLMKSMESGPNPEVAHYVERSWCSIFDIKTTDVVPSWLDS